MASEIQDHALSALLESVKSNTTVSKRMEMLEHRFGSLEDVIDSKMGILDQEMNSMNAHLDNLVRGVGITNGLLQAQLDAQNAEKLKKEKQEAAAAAEKLAQQETEHKKKHMWFGALQAPLGISLSALLGWALYHFLGFKVSGWGGP